MIIKCPHCAFTPQGERDWNCQACSSEFDMFEQAGDCTVCGFNHQQTPCIPWRDGCEQTSDHLDWYSGIDDKLFELGIVKNHDK